MDEDGILVHLPNQPDAIFVLKIWMSRGRNNQTCLVFVSECIMISAMY
jgi:hypothetical protein